VLTLRGPSGVRCGPYSGNLEVIEDGSVFIQGGKIVSVGPTRRLENLKEARGAIQIAVPNCIVMPAFVDASIHLSRDCPHARCLRRLSEFQNDSVALMRSCLQHGTLSAIVKATSGIYSLGAELSVLRQLARIGDSPISLFRAWSPSTGSEDHPDAAIFDAAFASVAKRKLAESIELKGDSSEILSAAIRSRLGVTLDWSGGAPDDLKQSLQRSGAASVFCHHSLSPPERELLTAAHAIAVFSAGGALIDTAPGSSVRDLIDAGGAVALGSGYHALYEPNFNMQLVLFLAVRRLNLTIEQAIVASTINAACVMRRDHQIGSIEPGKRADLLVMNIPDYREFPRRLGVNHVAMAIRNGDLVLNRTRWKVGAA
jgi:imidazolonepropionase